MELRTSGLTNPSYSAPVIHGGEARDPQSTQDRRPVPAVGTAAKVLQVLKTAGKGALLAGTATAIVGTAGLSLIGSVLGQGTPTLMDRATFIGQSMLLFGGVGAHYGALAGGAARLVSQNMRQEVSVCQSAIAGAVAGALVGALPSMSAMMDNGILKALPGSVEMGAVAGLCIGATVGIAFRVSEGVSEAASKITQRCTHWIMN